jgi:hypothetical protein
VRCLALRFATVTGDWEFLSMAKRTVHAQTSERTQHASAAGNVGDKQDSGAAKLPYRPSDFGKYRMEEFVRICEESEWVRRNQPIDSRSENWPCSR